MQPGFEFSFFLSQPLECQGYMCAPPQLALCLFPVSIFYFSDQVKGIETKDMEDRWDRNEASVDS